MVIAQREWCKGQYSTEKKGAASHPDRMSAKSGENVTRSQPNQEVIRDCLLPMATAKIIFRSGGNLGDPPPPPGSRPGLRAPKKKNFLSPPGRPPPPSGQAPPDLTPLGLWRDKKPLGLLNPGSAATALRALTTLYLTQRKPVYLEIGRAHV